MAGLMIREIPEIRERQVKVHWHFNVRKYSVSLRASNGRWYVVRDLVTGEQVLYGKLVLKNVRFQVAPAGAKRAWETGKRNVHATVIGTVVSEQREPAPAIVPCGIGIMYSHNLYSDPEFKALVAPVYQSSDFAALPGVKSAEFVAMGVRGSREQPRPNMLGINLTYTKG